METPETKRLEMQEIIQMMRKHGCKKINEYPLETMSRYSILDKLKDCPCPKLQELKVKLNLI